MIALHNLTLFTFRYLARKGVIKPLGLIFIFALLQVLSFGQAPKFTSTSLNLRDGPSTSHKILTTIPPQTKIEILNECDCDWVEVYYNSHIGYVSTKYLTTNQAKNNKELTSGGYKHNRTPKVKYYTNTSGQRVQSPTNYDSAPSGATALCRDGTYSFSMNRRGTCSRHGGVEKWLR